MSKKPILVYDGDCSFCRLWIDYWKSLTAGIINYAPFQEVASQFPTVPKENFIKSVILVLPNGKIFSGAKAVFFTLASVPGKRWMNWSYDKIPGFALISEWFYKLVANHRSFFYKLTVLLWGKRLEKPQYTNASWLFTKILGIVYFIAFASLWVQITGLVGSNGILPAGNFLQAVYENMGSAGYLKIPTLAWLNSGNGFLEFLTGGGALLSLLIIFGIAVRPVLIILWLFYLSLVSVGQIFMSFQWDILLLEIGFLAIFLRSSPTTVRWLFHWLLFRFIFLSGAVKLLSGDITWRNLTALNFHYYTQPLPTWIGWYVHQLPEWFDKMSVAIMFLIELAVPFLIFMPRHPRLFAAFSIIFLEILILLTGNYTFFNLLTISLALLLIDDTALKRFLPKKIIIRAARSFSNIKITSVNRFIVPAIAISIIFISGFQIIRIFFNIKPKPVNYILSQIAPLRIVNTYGLFAVMTTSRPEIIIEGSRDGNTWLEYEFKYKPQDLKQGPRWVAPHQPRLDWQMWFAALSSYQNNPWFVNFAIRLLQGSPEVIALIDKNPFPTIPPKYIRAVVYDYKFTDLKTKKSDGTWWKRELLGLYLPSVTLSN